MKTLLQKIKFWLLFLLPILYISYIFYIRIVLKRLPRDLTISLSLLKTSIILLIIALLLWRIYILLKNLELLPEKKKKTKIIIWLQEKGITISKYISNIWIDFFRVVFTTLIKLHLFVIEVAKFLQRHQEPAFIITVIMLFEVLPKIIVVSAFLVDIYIFKQLFFFYKALIVLLLPLTYSALYAILKQTYKDHLELYPKFLKPVFWAGEDNIYATRYEFVDGYVPPDFVRDINDFLDNHHYPILNIKDTLLLYTAVKKIIKVDWIFLAILVLHLIGWLTILYWGLFI